MAYELKLSDKMIAELCDPWNDELRENVASVVSALRELKERDLRIARDYGISLEKAERLYYTLSDKQRRVYN